MLRVQKSMLELKPRHCQAPAPPRELRPDKLFRIDASTVRLVQFFHALSGLRTASERVGRWRPWLGRWGRWSRAASVGRPLATEGRPLGSMTPRGVCGSAAGDRRPLGSMAPNGVCGSAVGDRGSAVGVDGPARRPSGSVVGDECAQTGDSQRRPHHHRHHHQLHHIV